jgi:glycosyltransferase involved in cell wall biosynthesis
MGNEANELRRCGEAAGWSDRVHDAGWVEMSRLRAFFAAADVAIYPFDDTLINRTKAAVKLMDLLAAGVPVVAERVGQIREYISPGENGLLVASGDTQGMTRAVIDLLNDPSRRKSLGDCAVATMTRAYDWDKLAERVDLIYKG